MSDPVLIIDRLTKKYGDFTAVKDLSLNVESGELFGLLGPNGAGKSTTIRVCLGLMSRTSGDIRIFGMDSQADSVEIRRRTGYLPGDFGLLPGISVQALLKYLLSLSNVSSDRKMLELAERLDLDLKKKTNELSKGNRQKVGIVQAFMADQDLIILDEPSSGLDPLMQQEFYRILREERDAGRTIFMSSHVLAEVEAVSDRVAIIREGELVLVDSISRLRDMTGKVLEVEFKGPVDPGEFRKIRGVSDLVVDGRNMTMTVTGNLDRVIKKVGDHGMINMNLRTYSLEQLFLRYYTKGGVRNGKGGDAR